MKASKGTFVKDNPRTKIVKGGNILEGDGWMLEFEVEFKAEIHIIVYKVNLTKR